MAKITKEIREFVQGLEFAESTKQQFYIKALEREEEFGWDSKEHMAGYVIRSLWNLQSNQNHIDARRQELIRDNHDAIATGTGMSDYRADSPLELLIAEQEVDSALQGISALLAHTLEDHYVNGMTPEEIAERDGDNVEAVRKRITRARNILKEIANE